VTDFGGGWPRGQSGAQSIKPSVLRGSRHAYVAMSKLVQVILAEYVRLKLAVRPPPAKSLKSLFPETHIRGGFPVIFGRP
jgi:hypothetical protein